MKYCVFPIPKKGRVTGQGEIKTSLANHLLVSYVGNIVQILGDSGTPTPTLLDSPISLELREPPPS